MKYYHDDKITAIAKHQYIFIEDGISPKYKDVGPGWNWHCSCGGKGRVTWQSDGVPYHYWLGHVQREIGKHEFAKVTKCYGWPPLNPGGGTDSSEQ